MKKFFVLLVCFLLIFTLVACDEENPNVPAAPVCQHRDADDNSLCDKCGDSYTDGKDIDDSTPCSHRDADDNSLCDKCGESYTDGKDVENNPTCQHRDADDNSLCDKCGVSYTDGKDVDDTPACQHRDADDNSLCDKCGESYTDGKDLPDEHIHEYTVKNTDSKYLATEASCENAATYYYSCSCGAKGTTTYTYGSPNGHSYTVKNTDAKYLATEADCENAATYYYSCSCGAKSTTTYTYGSPNGHSYTVKNTDSKYLASVADCDNAAKYYYSCSCGTKGTTTYTYGSPNGHSYTVKNTDSKYLATSANCDNAATYYYSCSCGAKGTTTFAHGVPNGHSYVVQNIDPKYEKSPASEYAPAIYWKSCACGKASATETFIYGDMLPGYLTYRLSSDSSYYIVTGFVGAQENVTIPHIYDSLPVFGVMANAFKNNTNLKSISMPNSIQEIGSYAFAGCTSLESVSIPTSVKNVSPYTFSGCTSLKTITLHSGIDELGAFAFENCTALKSITLNEGLKTISNNAFDNCSALGSISIPDTVTSLGNMAFRNNVSLKSVKFSKELKSIGNATFQNCISLTSIELHENITTLGNSTFSDCRGLKSLRILGDLTSIGFSTFYDCRALESIYFASKTKGDCGSTNYIFYNAGVEGNGITLTIAADAVIPEGFFTPYNEDNMPKITKIVISEGATKVNGFVTYNELPYLTSITYPSTVTDPSYGAFNNSLWWDNQELGEVYISGVFYGYKCHCYKATPKSPVEENRVEATCTTDGSYDAVVYCGVCNDELKRTTTVIPEKGHTPTVDLICAKCGTSVIYYREENYIYFGEYPQSIKANGVTITAQTDSRGYYLGSDGYYYAKVTADPYGSGYTFSTGGTVTSGTVYYFKVEPIRWRILSTDGETAFILCDSIIANKRYDDSSNNYANSEVRQWLNETFYETAFSEMQKEIILTTTVDNSAASTGYSSNSCACGNTKDKIFLLSYKEVTNSAYGFSSSDSTYDTARRMQTSDYSRATGAYMSTSSSYYGNGWWWLRSPNRNDSCSAREVNSDGSAYDGYSVLYSFLGVVPALQIRL